VQILLLGPIELTTPDGTSVPLGGPKPKALLMALLQQPRQVVSAERIIDLVWDESPPLSAAASVHTYVSTLRRGIAKAGGGNTALLTRPPGYLLDVPATSTDLGVFTDLVGQARRAERDKDLLHAAELYDAALRLWRGPALGGVDAGFAGLWAASLAEERLDAEEGVARTKLALGRAGDVIPSLIRLVDAYPLREESRALLMRALHVSGRQAEALEIYREGRAHLLDELGIEPGEGLRKLHATILAGPAPAPARPPVQAPAPRPDDYVAPSILPPDIGDFTGREPDLEAILGLASEPMTVVVSGIGGVGKSALAVHAAHLLRSRFPDGQLFADLRGTGRDLEAHEVLGRFLQALGVPAAAVPPRTDEREELYRSRVAGRRLIMVLDNAHNERQVRPLLPGGPGSLVVITSRSRLTGLAGTRSIELGYLAPDSAIALLSKMIGADRVATQRQQAERIARLCGGLPLAIRAAGAKLLARPHWPLKSLVARLSDEHRRLDELTVGDLAIRSSLRLNHAELDERQRRAFHLLCLLDLPDFGWWLAGPLVDVPPQDAEDIVEHLVDLRLVDVTGVDSIGRVRYRLHDLVQLFGAEQQESGVDAAAAVSRTLTTAMVLIEQSTRDLPHVTVPLCPVRVPDVPVDPLLIDDVEYDPAEWLRSEAAAVVRLVERASELHVDHSTIVSMAALLTKPFATRNEFDKWRRVLDVALSAAKAGADQAAEAAMLAGLGQVHAEQDDFPAALTYFRQASTVAAAISDRGTLAVTLIGSGNVQRELASSDAAVTDLIAAASLGAEIGNLDVVAAANYGLGAISRDHGDIPVATTQFQRCAETYRAAGDLRGAALALRGLSLCHRAVDEYPAAADLALQAAEMLTDTGDELGAAYARQSWAKASLRMGHHQAAAEAAETCLDMCTRRQDRFGVALMTRTVGEILLATGNLAAARESLDAALLMWTTLELPLWQARTLRDLAAANVTDDPATAEAQWAQAQRLCAAAHTRESTELAGLTPTAWLAKISL
jgi:DNA-binding SARP family transcriptional activator